jgi:hypothetical protein
MIRLHRRHFLTALLAAACLPSAGLAASAFDHSHAPWSVLLVRHVSWTADGHASVVDYAGMQDDRKALKAYLAALSRVTQQEYDSWTKAQRLAFLINAYNAFTVELILTKYPDLKSIKDLGSLIQSPWKKRFFELLGRPRTLDELEHGMIRAPGAFDDPRIHMAVNCASIGCPALRPEAFVADKLDEQLEDGVRRFLADRGRNRAEADVLRVSKIFDWYGDDFAAKAGSVANWLARYADRLTADPSVQRNIREAKLPVRFLDYDWMLNARRR